VPKADSAWLAINGFRVHRKTIASIDALLCCLPRPLTSLFNSRGCILQMKQLPKWSPLSAKLEAPGALKRHASCWWPWVPVRELMQNLQGTGKKDVGSH
jgi:hypothetical protein